jgi:hypothetical protein
MEAQQQAQEQGTWQESRMLVLMVPPAAAAAWVEQQ